MRIFSHTSFDGLRLYLAYFLPFGKQSHFMLGEQSRVSTLSLSSTLPLRSLVLGLITPRRAPLQASTKISLIGPCPKDLAIQPIKTRRSSTRPMTLLLQSVLRLVLISLQSLSIVWGNSRGTTSQGSSNPTCSIGRYRFESIIPSFDEKQ